MRQKRQCPCSGAWNERSIQFTTSRRSAPANIPRDGITRSDSPGVFAVGGKLGMEIDAELTMRFCGDHRVFEIIRVSIALAAKIDPGMGKLMNEKRSAIAEECVTVVFDGRAFPGVPAFGRNGMAL